MGVTSGSCLLRVANVVEEGRVGGPQKRIAAVAAVAKEFDVETIVLLPKKDSEQFRNNLEKLEIGYRVMRLNRLGRGARTLVTYVFNFLSEIMGLYRELRGGKYDVVHVSGGAWQIKGVIAGRMAGIPVIWHLNDTYTPLPIRLLFRILSYYFVTGFIVTANRVFNYYLEGTTLSKMPIFHIQAPVDTSQFDPDTVKPDKEVYAYPSIRIVTVANINPIKNLEMLIETAKLLVLRGCKVSFLVVGPVFSTQQKYSNYLRSQVHEMGVDDCFHFLGNRDNIAEILKAADIFVCSSKSESGPMTVWEAMSMECPVVSTNVGDVSSYIFNGENGFVVPIGDVYAMADAIQSLISDPVLRIRIGRRARETARKKFDVNKVAQQTVYCYRHILNRHVGSET